MHCADTAPVCNPQAPEEVDGSDRIPKTEPLDLPAAAPHENHITAAIAAVSYVQHGANGAPEEDEASAMTAGAAALLPTTHHVPLSRMQHSRTHPKHLHSNSTTHTWAFGAIAELIDNALDAGAHRISIEHVRLADQSALLFTDNGQGLDHEGLVNMCSFGVCEKKGSEIGEYGNGFKSGAMRTGRTCVVLTKQADMLVGVLLSQTFLANEKATEIVLPMGSWVQHGAGYQRCVQASEQQGELLCEYSGIDSETALLSLVQEKLGAEASGTMIIVTELTDIWGLSEPGDLVLTEAEVRT